MQCTYNVDDLISVSRTKVKEFGIQILERDGWKRTVVDALPKSKARKEMAIISNEPSDVATAGERIWINLKITMIFNDGRDELK